MDKTSYAPDECHPDPGDDAGKGRKRTRVDGAYRDQIDHWRNASNGQFVVDPLKQADNGLLDDDA